MASIFETQFSHRAFCLTSLMHLSPKRCIRSLFSTSWIIFSARALGFLGGNRNPLIPFFIHSRFPGMSVTTGASPHAIASRRETEVESRKLVET